MVPSEGSRALNAHFESLDEISIGGGAVCGRRRSDGWLPAKTRGVTSSYRAGNVTLSTASANTTVTFSSPLASASYEVELTLTSATNFTSSSGWGYPRGTTRRLLAGLRLRYATATVATKIAPSATTVDYIVMLAN